MTVADSRRLLLIDYHFGTPGATGGIRWRAMAPHLAAEGWRFDVVTRGAPGDSTGEPWQEGVRLFRVAQPTTADDVVAAAGRIKRMLLRRAPDTVPAAPPPARDAGASGAPAAGGAYARLARAVNGLRITAAEWGWSRRATREAVRLARLSRYHAVIVSSPPHLSQLAGAAVGRRCALPFVADFRDPWVFGRPEKYDVNPLANRLGRVYERRTLRGASLILCNTDHARQAVAALYPDLAGRSLGVPNGYDAAGEAPPVPDPACFRIAFAGWFYPFMDAEVVLAAAGRLRRRAGLGAPGFSVEFMGCDSDHRGVPFESLAARHGLEGCFRRHPAAPREVAHRFQASAAVLVAFDASTQLAMPTKFYDYARLGGAPLLIGFPDGAMAAAAERLGARVFAADDQAGMDAALDDALARWRAGTLLPPRDRAGVFDRRIQSRRVHEVLAALRG